MDPKVVNDQENCTCNASDGNNSWYLSPNFIFFSLYGYLSFSLSLGYMEFGLCLTQFVPNPCFLYV